MNSYQNLLHIVTLKIFQILVNSQKLVNFNPTALLFDLEEVRTDKKDKTNLTSLAEEIITPIKMDLTDKIFGIPEAQNPIFNAEETIIIDDDTIHDKLSSSSAKKVENRDVDIMNNIPTLPITKQTDAIIDTSDNQQKTDDQIDQQQPNKGLSKQIKKTHKMMLRTRKPITNINKSDRFTRKKKVTFSLQHEQ